MKQNSNSARFIAWEIHQPPRMLLEPAPADRLDPDRAEHQPALDQTCLRAGVETEKLRVRPMNDGVPHVVPKALKKALSDDWLACLEMFPTLEPWTPSEPVAASRESHVGPQKNWLATMWALVLAVDRLDLEPVMTEWGTSNCGGYEPLPAENASGSTRMQSPPPPSPPPPPPSPPPPPPPSPPTTK